MATKTKRAKASSIKKSYERQGYYVNKSTNKRHKKIVEACAKKANQLIDDSTGFKKGFRGADGKFKHLKDPNEKIKCFKDLINSPEVKSVLKAIYGKERVYVTHSKISYKRKGSDHVWQPHQDSAYNLKDKDGMTIAVFLCDTSDKNGGLQVWPRSHKLGRLKHENIVKSNDKDPQLVLAEEVPMKAKSMSGKKGDFVVFHIDALHGSPANTTEGNRPYHIFEVEPFSRFITDKRGRVPVVLNGKLSGFEYAVSYSLGIPKMMSFYGRKFVGKFLK